MGILVLVAVIVMVIKTREHLSIADFLDLNKLIDFITIFGTYLIAVLSGYGCINCPISYFNILLKDE